MATKKAIMRKVLCCLAVLVIMTNAMSVSVFALNGSNNSTGNASNSSDSNVSLCSSRIYVTDNCSNSSSSGYSVCNVEKNLVGEIENASTEGSCIVKLADNNVYGTQANTPPTLMLEAVNGENSTWGTDLTNFVFSVVYYDQDNDSPKYIKVTINGMAHNMAKQNSMDSNYADGCTYVYSTTLASGTYQYSFATSDGYYQVSIDPVYSCPSRDDFVATAIRIAMKDYLTTPAGSSIFTKYEVKDMIDYYLYGDCSNCSMFDCECINELIYRAYSKQHNTDRGVQVTKPQCVEVSVTWDVNVGVAPKIIGFTQVPSNPVGTGEVYYVVTYKNDEQDESFVTLDIQEGNKVVKEPIEYIKGHGQLSDASKAAVKGNMAAIFEKVLDKMVDEGLLDFFNDYLGQDLDSFLDVEDAIGFKIFSQFYSDDDYGEDYDIKVIVEDEEGKDSKALTTNVREYYIGIIEEEIEDTNNNPEDGRQIEGIINIPFNYCLPSHDAYILFVGGEKIIEANVEGPNYLNAKVKLPAEFDPFTTQRQPKDLSGTGKENIKLTTHLFKNPCMTKIKIVLLDGWGNEYSDDVTLDFQNNYYVNPNWEGRFTEYRRGNEIFKADLTKSQFEEEFKDTNVLRLTKEVEENLNNNKYYDGAYIPDEQRGYANNLMSFEAAELEFVGKNEIKKMKWINDIWAIYGWFGHMKTGVEILVQGADFVTNFNPTKFLLKTLAEEGIGLVISATTDVWKDALAGDGENIMAIYDDAPSGDLEGNKYGVFTHVHAKQSKYEDGGELKEIINAKKIIWRFTQPFFLCESGKWEFVATGTGAGGIVDADYIPGGANCIEWRSKPEFISPKEKNTVSFAGEIKRGVFPDYENQRDLFFVIELPDAYEILYDKKGTGFKLSEFTGVETPIELPIEDNLNDKNEEIETEYTKLYDRAGDNIFRIYVKETEDKWYVKNDGVETDYYDFKPVTVHPRLFAVNLEKSLGKPYLFGFTLTVDKDLKEDKYDDYVIKYGVFPGKVSNTSEDDVIYAENYKSMISYDINSANGLNLRDSFSLKVTDEVSVSGQVIDKESGEPISNAVVGVYHGIGQILDPYTYTDSDGKFNLNYLGEEPFTLAAWKEGYIREEKEVNQGTCTFYLISQDPGETFTNTIGMDFVLIPAGEFDMGSPPMKNIGGLAKDQSTM